jgi:hypothetical protein
MKDRFCYVLGILLVLAFGWAMRQALLPREPLYDGKPFSCWLDSTNSLSGRKLPDDLLSDPNTIPILVKALRRDRGAGAACYRKWLWPNIPSWIQTRLPTPPDHSHGRWEAILLLEKMGPSARPAIPALIRCMEVDDDIYIRLLAARVLSSIGKADKTAVAALTAALNDNWEPMSEAATNALWRMDPGAAAKAGVNSNTVVEALIEGLKSEALDVRRAATNGLLKLGREVAAIAGVDVWALEIDGAVTTDRALPPPKAAGSMPGSQTEDSGIPAGEL